ncbi:TIGR04282 family arsenosugar biosynthesis glycosyltransferase [Qipengyuania spongiae]|uniref:TIGR04282 family arsenosugar biosynthesis glycosyltransferase n=1 Tax=Qipengyuania spongiae TaxID=2909673 RepID=A0ABY5T0P5_9SPHN|nr:TIGR04282 family arsenosugar biosynthesis glycosyltransferase [Qipengyuania spongiae]UVI40348.1 TIGR04282 family arsenosugar biosynthesis glycosyltransferase [Qipengyuania spongiae]
MPPEQSPALAIFARWPEPGAAKTRLIPALGAEGAAEVYRRLLAHTIDEARHCGLPVVVRTTGADPARFRAAFGRDIACEDQGEGDLGERLARVPAPAIIIGSDCPDCDASTMRRAAEALRTHPAVIGPASDGGYYLIGLAEAQPAVFADMEWSTETVFAETMHRFAAAGIAPLVLPRLDDIDTPEDLARHPGFAP